MPALDPVIQIPYSSLLVPARLLKGLDSLATLAICTLALCGQTCKARTTNNAMLGFQVFYHFISVYMEILKKTRFTVALWQTEFLAFTRKCWKHFSLHAPEYLLSQNYIVTSNTMTEIISFCFCIHYARGARKQVFIF